MRSSKVCGFRRPLAACKRPKERSCDSNMHSASTVLIVVIMATSASATLWMPNFGVRTQNASRVCIYSSDPTKYPPKCFLCIKDVYNSAVKACVNGSESMPSNITFGQAKCVESNCAINYPVNSPATPSPYLPQKLELLSSLIKGAFKGKRSIPDEELRLHSENDIVVDHTNLVTTESYDEDSRSKKVLLQLKGMDLSKEQNVRITQFVDTFASYDAADVSPDPLEIQYEDY